MPRSEENRCLHCGSRLPLIRKLRDGQFCTAAHRKAYLDDQQRLALERLSAASLSNLVAATAPEPEAVREMVPEMAAVQRGGGAPPAPAAPAQSDPVAAAPDWEPAALASRFDLHERDRVTRRLEQQAPFWVIARDAEIREAQVTALALTQNVEIFEPLLSARPGCGPAQAEPVRYFRLPEAAGASPRHPEPAPLTPEYLDLPLPPTPVAAAWAWAERLAGSRWKLTAVFGSAQPFSRLETTEPSDRPVWCSLLSRPVAIEWDWMDMVPPRTDLASLSPGSGVPALRSATTGGGGAEPWVPSLWRPSVPVWLDRTGLAAAGRAGQPLAARRLAPQFTNSAAEAVSTPAPRPEYPVRMSQRRCSPRWAGQRVAVPAPRRASWIPQAGSTEPFSGLVMRPVPVLRPALGALPEQALPPGFPVRNPYVPGAKAAPLRPASRPDFRPIPTPVVAGWFRIQTRARMQGAHPVLRIDLAAQPFPLPGLRPRLRVEPVEVQLDPRAGIPLAGRTRPAAKPLLSIHTEPEERQRSRALSLAGFWSNAPRDLKMMTLSLPLLLLLAIKPSLPKVAVAAPGDLELKRTLQTQWGAVQQNISSRAGIEYSEDFRAGLDQWESRGDLTTEWAYDAAGFVHPGPLAIFKPTLALQNYSAEFLGMVDQRALGFVFRATDLDNYQAVKLTVVRAGPLPTIALVRYAVVGGKAEEAKTTILPITVRRDTLYRVRVDVRDDNFAVTVQGTLVDFWSDGRLRTGGIGFFAGKGEESRVRWVQVTHQYDALGRLCAFLAPYNLQAGNGSFKP